MHAQRETSDGCHGNGGVQELEALGVVYAVLLGQLDEPVQVVEFLAHCLSVDVMEINIADLVAEDAEVARSLGSCFTLDVSLKNISMISVNIKFNVPMSYLFPSHET